MFVARRAFHDGGMVGAKIGRQRETRSFEHISRGVIISRDAVLFCRLSTCICLGQPQFGEAVETDCG